MLRWRAARSKPTARRKRAGRGPRRRREPTCRRFRPLVRAECAEGRPMSSKVAAAVVGAALVAAAAVAQQARTSDALERPFVSNGRIRMNLSAGDYRIVGGPADRIRVEWSARDAAKLPRVRIGADVRGTEAALSTDSPGNSGFKADVHVPAPADP